MLLQFLITPVINILLLIIRGWETLQPGTMLTVSQNTLGIFICSLLYVSSVKDRNNRSLRTASFAYLVSLTGWMMFLTNVSFLIVVTDGNHPFMIGIETLLNFCSLLLSLAFLTYLCELADIAENQEKVLKNLVYAGAIPEFLLLLGNLVGHYFFYINADNKLVEKPFYLVFMAFPLLMNCLLLFFIIKMPAERSVKRTLVNFITFPSVAVIIYAITGILFIYPAMLCSLIFIYGNVFTEYESNLAKKSLEIAKKENELLLAKHNQIRVETELDMAAKIQTHVLPRTFPPFPEYDAFDIYASMKPAKEVGGDFYDLFLVDKDHMAMVIADVSGKGVPAALYMMIAKTMIKHAAMQGNSPAKTLEIVNNQLCDSDEDMEMFVTAWVGIYEISTGKLTAANAGHEYPVISYDGNKFTLIKDKHGIVLGAFSGRKYTEYEICMAPGDTLFVYTDGVPEAVNVEVQQFGNERMLEALNRHAGGSMEDLIRAVNEELFRYIDGEDQFDDVTMLAMHVNHI